MDNYWMWILLDNSLIQELREELWMIGEDAEFRNRKGNASVLSLKHSVGLSTVIQELIK